jgi:iron complex outermembrane receptor protein
MARSIRRAPAVGRPSSPVRLHAQSQRALQRQSQQPGSPGSQYRWPVQRDQLGSGGVNLTGVTAWRRLYFRPYNDSDYTPLDIYRAGYDVDVNQYSQEIRLASEKGSTIDWQVGAYYLHEKLRSNLRTIFGSDASTFFLGAGVPSSYIDGLEYDRDGRLTIDSLAGFGQVTAHLSSTFSITGGVRYTWEKSR